MSNILIIKHGSLGDISQASGAIQDIFENHKNDQIHLLTTKPFIDLFKKNPFIHNVILDKRLPRFNLIYLYIGFGGSMARWASSAPPNCIFCTFCIFCTYCTSLYIFVHFVYILCIFVGRNGMEGGGGRPDQCEDMFLWYGFDVLNPRPIGWLPTTFVPCT